MSWAIFFLMLPHLKPDSLQYLCPAAEILFDAGKLFSTMVILCLYLLEKRIPSPPVWILAALQGWFCVATLINHGELYPVFISSVSVLAVSLLIDLCAGCMGRLVQSILLNFEILIYLNLLSVLIYYPNGMYIESGHFYRCYFLGYHNLFIGYVVPAVLTALVYRKSAKKFWRPLCLIAASCLSIIITWSATSICFLLVLGAMLLMGRTSVRKAVSFPLVFAGTMAVNLAISVFRVMDRFPPAVWFIGRVLKKQVTLTGRTAIWDEFYQWFVRSPLIGYGSTYSEVARNVFLADHAHNQWFQMLFYGGIVGLTIFLLFNVVIGNRLCQFRETPCAYLCLSVFAALYIAFIAEAYYSPVIYIFFMTAYHVDKFQDAQISRKRFFAFR